MKKIVIILGIVIAILLAILLLVPTDKSQTSNDPNTLNIVTTFFPLYDFAQNITEGVENVEVDILFTQTPEVSSFKPSDVQKIAHADVLIMNGAGLEHVLEELLIAAGNKHLHVINTSEGITILDTPELGHDDHGHDDHDDHGHHGHAHEEGDPHIWLDITNAMNQVETISNELRTIDPENADAYHANWTTYHNKLSVLHDEVQDGTAQFTQREIITFHPAFQYFANRYNLEIIAVFEASPGKEPSPADLAHISELVEEHGITALFAEPQFESKVVRTLADDLDIEVRTLNPIESGDLDDDSYIELMRENLQELQAVLQ